MTSESHLRKIIKIFSRHGSSPEKKKILNRMVGQIALRDVDSLIEGIKSYDCKFEFISCFSASHAGALKKKYVQRKEKIIRNRMQKTAKKIYKNLLKEDRNRNKSEKNFDTILFEIIEPYIQINEYTLIERVLKLATTIKHNNSYRILYTTLVTDLSNVLKIVRQIKGAGISGETIEKILLQNREGIFRKTQRDLLRRIMLQTDKCFKNHRKVIETTLTLFQDEELKRKQLTTIPHKLEHEFNELCEARNITTILKKASKIYSVNAYFMGEIFIVFELFVNAPLIEIYKILKFPGSRETFKRWIKNRTLPWLNKELQTHFTEIETEKKQKSTLYRDYSSMTDFICLIYDPDINFTDKYSLILKYAEKMSEKRIFSECLNAIKSSQYNFETTFLQQLLKDLYIYTKPKEIDSLFRRKRIEILKKIKAFKIKFREDINKIKEKIPAEIFKSLEYLEPLVSGEESIESDRILKLYEKIMPVKNFNPLKFITEFSNFLRDYYMVLDCRNIITHLKNHYSFLKLTDGIFLKQRLSSFSVRDIYEYCNTSGGLLPSVIHKLNTFLKWGKGEIQVREYILKRISSILKPHGEKEIDFIVRRYKHVYIFTMWEGMTEEKKWEEDNIITFMDFYNSIINDRIYKKVQMSPETISVRYHEASIAYLRLLKEYIKFKLKFLQIKSKGYDRGRGPLYEINLRKIFIRFLNRVLNLIPDYYAEEKEIILEEIKGCTETITSMEYHENEMNIEKTLTTDLFENITTGKMKSFFTIHRALPNREYLNYLKNNIDSLAQNGSDDVKALITSLEQPELLPFDEGKSIFEGKYTGLLEARVDLWQVLILNSIEVNILDLKDLIHNGKDEVKIRSEYISQHRQDPFPLLYEKEVNIQESIIADLTGLIQFAEEKLVDMFRIKTATNKVLSKLADIRIRTEEEPEEKRPEKIIRLSETTQNTDENLLLALLLRIELNDRLSTIINQYKSSRYYCLVNLVKIIDEEQDYYRKIRLINDFNRYLNNSLLYFEIQFVIIALKKKLIKTKKKNEGVITEFINKIPKQRDERKSYIKNIVIHTTDTHLKDFIGIIQKNKSNNASHIITLSIDERLYIMKNLFWTGGKTTDEGVKEEELKERIELLTKKRLYLSKKIRIFKPATLDLLFSPESNSETVCRELRREMLTAERKAVERSLREHGIPGMEIIDYLDKYLPRDRKKNGEMDAFRSIVQKINGFSDLPAKLNYIRGLKQDSKDAPLLPLLDLLYTMYKNNTMSPVKAVLKMTKTKTKKIELLQWLKTSFLAGPKTDSAVEEAVRKININSTGGVLIIDETHPHSLKQALQNENFDFYFAESAKKGYEILSTEQIDIILTDYKLPDINGMSFLKDIKIHYPKIIRMIYSEFVEEKILLEALNNNWATLFFRKPWNDNMLAGKITQFLKWKKELNLTNRHILQVINTTDSLPVIPYYYNKLFHAYESPGKSSEIPVKLLSQDPVVVARIFQVTNSITFGKGQIISIEEALKTTRQDYLRSIIFSLKTSHDLGWDDMREQHLRDIFIQSECINRYFPLIYMDLYHKSATPRYVSAASLANIGKILLLTHVPDHYAEVITYLTDHPVCSFYEAEKALNLQNRSYTLYGSHLLRLWNIPAGIADLTPGHYDHYSGDREEHEFSEALNHTERFIHYIRENLNHPDHIETAPFTQTGIEAARLKKIFSYIHNTILEMEQIVRDPYVY